MMPRQRKRQTSESSDEDLIEALDQYAAAVTGEDREIEDGNDDDDDSNAPEEVSFTSSKKSVLDKKRKVSEQIRSEKAAHKEKRRKRDTFLKSQKELKSQLSSSEQWLPDDILEAVDNLPVQTSSHKRTDVIIRREQRDHLGEGSDVSDRLSTAAEDLSCSEDEEDVPTGDQLEECEDASLEPSDRPIDFIVVPLKNQAKFVNKSSYQTALDWKSNMLYGKRVPRMKTKNLLGLLAKQKMCNPMVNAPPSKVQRR